jgi:hypothetical protein
MLRECQKSPRDEVLVTWFADELYRFRGDTGKEHAIDRHFGMPAWQPTRQVTGEAVCKAELLKIYLESLRSLPGVHAGAFEIASKNETARYALILATHSDAGLECFNQMKWRIDPHHGRQASEKHIGQPSLFDDEPISSRNDRSSVSTCACTITSSAVVGSSATTSDGRPAIAIAIITRCRSPPDSSCG